MYSLFCMNLSHTNLYNKLIGESYTLKQVKLIKVKNGQLGRLKSEKPPMFMHSLKKAEKEIQEIDQVSNQNHNS